MSTYTRVYKKHKCNIQDTYMSPYTCHKCDIYVDKHVTDHSHICQHVCKRFMRHVCGIYEIETPHICRSIRNIYATYKTQIIHVKHKCMSTYMAHVSFGGQHIGYIHAPRTKVTYQRENIASSAL